MTEKPKRRERYVGTHPKKFSEKYKELNPEKYSTDVEKIKARGSTPAGTHRPICVQEILDVLKPKQGEKVLDATLGYGGHARFLIEKIGTTGQFIGIDQDPIELPKTEKRLREIFSEHSLVMGLSNFGRARDFLTEKKIDTVDVVLADLGVSSMQIDDPARGFSFKYDGPLDLRMNPKRGISAEALINQTKEVDLVQLLQENSDEPYAEAIAKGLIRKRPKTTFETVEAVRNVIKALSPRIQREEGDSPVRRCFQALRIEVNGEFKALNAFLKSLPLMLSRGGRVAILSFHSGEDRRVKKSFQLFERSGIYTKTSDGPLRPTGEEQRDNPRSKSAKLRWAIRK